MKYIAGILTCPKCNISGSLQEEKNQLRCQGCGSTYPLENGIPNLVTDPALRTLLEDIDYDKVHGVDEIRRQRAYEDWAEILDTLAIESDKILEIGSGTGQLTWGLMHRSNFNEVYATDISGKFLNSIVENFQANAKNKTYYYICDANELPFKENSFDAVIGHSVLHHFLNYEQTLAAVYKILKKDGCAIFYEPILQGKIFVAFVLDLIQRMDKTLKMKVLTEKEREKIVQLVKHQTKDSFIKGNKKVLKDMEDKYIFDVNKLSALATTLGYSNFEFRNYKKLNPSYRTYVVHHWQMLGIDVAKLKQFEDIFEAFKGTIGALLSESISTPMGYLIFKK